MNWYSLFGDQATHETHAVCDENVDLTSVPPIDEQQRIMHTLHYTNRNQHELTLHSHIHGISESQLGLFRVPTKFAEPNFMKFLWLIHNFPWCWLFYDISILHAIYQWIWCHTVVSRAKLKNNLTKHQNCDSSYASKISNTTIKKQD